MAGSLIDTVAIELARAYPDQTIGIEGHTDNDFVRTAQGFDSQQLSVATGHGRLSVHGLARAGRRRTAVHRRSRQQPPGGIQRHRGRQGAAIPGSSW